MSKFKYYAVIKDGKKSIVNSWNECETLTKGVSGIEFKGFKTKKSAQEWLDERTSANTSYILSKLKEMKSFIDDVICLIENTEKEKNV
jgi:viroplasmin and RNaseH domain-containing protein